jgi:hypothetical protein
MHQRTHHHNKRQAAAAAAAMLQGGAPPAPPSLPPLPHGGGGGGGGGPPLRHPQLERFRAEMSRLGSHPDKDTILRATTIAKQHSQDLGRDIVELLQARVLSVSALVWWCLCGGWSCFCVVVCVRGLAGWLLVVPSVGGSGDAWLWWMCVLRARVLLDAAWALIEREAAAEM